MANDKPIGPLNLEFLKVMGERNDKTDSLAELTIGVWRIARREAIEEVRQLRENTHPEVRDTIDAVVNLLEAHPALQEKEE